MPNDEDHIGILFLQENKTTIQSFNDPKSYFSTGDMHFDCENTFMLDRGLITKHGTKKIVFMPEPVDITNTKTHKNFEMLEI